MFCHLVITLQMLRPENGTKRHKGLPLQFYARGDALWLNLVGPPPQVSGYFLKRRFFCVRFQKTKTQRNMIASLTEHALYDVWHHCIRKTLFSSVHTNDKPAIQKKAPLWGPFSKTWVSGAGKRCLRVDKVSKRRKKLRLHIYSDTCRRDLNSLWDNSYCCAITQ